MAELTGTTVKYGLMAEFKTPEALLAAARRTYAEGYRQMDAYTPIPIHGLAEAIGPTDRKVQIAVLVAGIVGMIAGFGLCVHTNALDVGGIFAGYPVNVGGRPLVSWPAYVVPTFETTILFAGITSLVSMLVFNGLPMPYHPVFNVERFRQHASTDAFFLCVETTDPRFDTVATRRFLEALEGASAVHEVER
jgi:hypothetical protein